MPRATDLPSRGAAVAAAIPLQDVELMAEREDLKMESGAGPEEAAEHRKQGNQDGDHHEQSLFGHSPHIQLHQHVRSFLQAQRHR
jgi:hypothetical protein